MTRTWVWGATIAVLVSGCFPGEWQWTPGLQDGGTSIEQDAADVLALPEVPATPTCGAGLGPCDPILQTGCAAGQMCQPYQVDATLRSRCVAAGARSVGSSCNGLGGAQDCQAGLYCNQSLRPPECRALCCRGRDDLCRSAPGGTATDQCIFSLRAGATEVGGPNGCSQGCDWTAQSCGGGHTCFPQNQTGASDCRPVGTRREGESCAVSGAPDDYACAEGLLCVTEAVDGSVTGIVCRRICDTRTGCPGTLTCCPSGSGLYPIQAGFCVRQCGQS